MAMAVTMRSVARHASRPISYYIIGPDFSEAQRRAVKAAANTAAGDTVEFIEPRRTFQQLHRGHNNSDAYYYRLALPEALPDHERILYLDADLLIRSDVVPLWDQICRSAGAVQASLEYEQKIDDTVLPVYREYGLTPESPYYNTGVMGMNLRLWRDQKLADQMVSFLEKHGDRCPAWDQAAINALLSHEIDRLPQEWNVFSLQASETTRIVHYRTFRKPFVRPHGWLNRQQWALAAWQAAMASNPYFREYFQVLDETPYRGWRPFSAQAMVFRVVPTALLNQIRSARFKLRASPVA